MKITSEVERMKIDDDERRNVTAPTMTVSSDDDDDGTHAQNKQHDSDDTESLHSNEDEVEEGRGHVADERNERQQENANIDGQKFEAGINCPEKIVFVLDTSYGMSRKVFGDEKALTNMTMTKKALEMFIKTKSTLNSKHEYLLIVVNDCNSPFILQDFTNDVKTIMAAIRDLDSQQEGVENNEHKEFAIDPLINFIEGNISWKRQQQKPLLDHTLRVIFINTSKQFTINTRNAVKTLKDMYGTEIFFFDSVSIMDPAVEQFNNAEFFKKMNIHKENYILTISRSQAEFFNCMSRMLAHPMQRAKLRS